jgi:hypothetical protein
MKFNSFTKNLCAILLAPMVTAGFSHAAGGRCGGVTVIIVTNEPSPFQIQSGDFNIAVTFDANVPAADRAVIQYAVNEWNAILQSSGVNPGTYPIRIAYGQPNNPDALASTTVSSRNGTLVSNSMVFKADELWFVDPTPADDSEFGSNPPAGYDLLTTARHELGHAFGWSKTSRTTNLVVNNVFDPARLNIALVSGWADDGGFHADDAVDPNELMTPTMGPGERRPIKLYPTATLVSRAFQYQIPMNFVDPANGGTQTGSAWEPWQTFQGAVAQAPAGIPLLLAPATFAVPRNQPMSGPHAVYSARGGATVIGQ